MTVTLTPEQMRWLEEAVAQGRFSSVEEAVAVAVADLKMSIEAENLEWARPYIEEARAQVARGQVVEGEEFLGRLRQGIDALRGR
jgi:Arc/MetJ-type ribon-helix-helix transcriptional regulator